MPSRSRLVVLAGLALATGLLSVLPLASAATLNPTTLTAAVSTTQPSYNQAMTFSGTISPRVNANGTARRVYLRTLMGSSWIDIASVAPASPSYSIGYRTTWTGTRKYQVWAPATSSNAAAYSQQFTVTHRKLTSTTTASLGPSPTEVGNRVVMRGKVSGGQVGGRTVTLYRVFPNGNRKERTTTTAADGSWSFTVPSWFLTDRDMVAIVSPTAASTGATSARRREKTIPTYTPAGTHDQYNWTKDENGIRYRWNGCRKEITYRVRPGGLGDAFVRETKAALSKVRQASGMRFRYLGTTSADPLDRHTFPAGTDLVVGYVKDSETVGDLTGLGGLAGPRYAVASQDYSGRLWEIRIAGVAIKKGIGLSAGFDGAMSRGQLLMHELGHAMGLAHAASGQVMYWQAQNHPRYGRGDLRGLQRVGYGLGGCTAPLNGARTQDSPGTLTP